MIPGTESSLDSPTSSPSRAPTRERSESDLAADALNKLKLDAIASRLTPPTTPVTDHARARTLLRSCNSNSYIGRGAERKIILDFLSPFCSGVPTGEPLSLYLSGSPGCVVFINCMGMSELGVAGVMRRVLEDVAPQKRVAKIDVEEAFAKLMCQNVKWCASKFILLYEGN